MVSRTRPRTSNPASGTPPVTAGTCRRPRTIAVAASGNGARNSHCQLYRSRMPLMAGPTMNATPNTDPRMPSALPCRWAGNSSPTTALETGKIPAAPMPCNARPASRTQNGGDDATINAPTENKAMSSVNTNRRPAASASFAMRGTPSRLNSTKTLSVHAAARSSIP